MKRCIICGSLGDDSSIYCPACGNMFPDDSVMDAVREETQGTGKAAAQEVWEAAAQQNDSVQELEAAGAEQHAASRVNRPEAVARANAPEAFAEKRPEAASQANASEAEIFTEKKPEMSRANASEAETFTEKKPEAMSRANVPEAETFTEKKPEAAPETRAFAEKKPEVMSRANMPKTEAFTEKRPKAMSRANASEAEAFAEKNPKTMSGANVPEAEAFTEKRPEAVSRANAPEAASQVRGPQQSAASGEAAPKRQASAAVQDPARRPRRGRSGPQIYGQGELPNDGQTTYAQGAIRRDISGGAQNPSVSRTSGIQRSTVAAQGQQTGAPGNGRPARQGAAGNGRPVNEQAQMAGRRGAEANGAVNQANGRPNRPMPGQQGGRQARPMQGNMQGQPNGRGGRAPMQGQQPGRPAQGYRPQGFAGVKIRETARGALKSPVFLLVALLHTVFLAGSVAAVIMSQLNYSQVVRLLAGFQLPAQLGSYMNTAVTLLTKLDSSAIILNLIFCIPDLLFCIGLWLVFCMARTEEEEMSGIGFTFMKIVVILNMIKSCLVMLILLVVAVALVISAWVSGMTGMLVASAVALVLIIAVTMAVIMYYFCYLATIRTCRTNAGTGERYGRVSSYVALIHIIGSLFSIIGILSGVVNMEIAGIVKSAGMLGWMLLFGVWIYMYRGRMSEFEE